MATKRKHTSLFLGTKRTILSRLANGESVTKLALEYGIGKATVCDIRRNAERIISFCAQSEYSQRKRKITRRGLKRLSSVKMSFSTETVTELYREWCKVPLIAGAKFLSNRENNLIQLAVEWNQTDLEKSEKIKLLNYITVDPLTLRPLTSILPPVDVTSEFLSSWSKCSRYRAVVRKTFNKSGEEKQFLEIWDYNSKDINIDIEAQEQHGRIYEDSQFGCLRWSSDAKRLLYIAEEKRPKDESFFKNTVYSSDTSKNGLTKTTQGDEYLFREDWGEKFVGKCCPVVCIFSLETKTISVIKNFPSVLSMGQAVWTPNNTGIVAVGWHHEPRRLGISVCSNRRSCLVHYEFDQEDFKIIGNDVNSVHSPRFSPDGTKLIYIETYAGGPHHNCSQLIMCQWPYDDGRQVIVDYVHEALGSSFPGLFLFSLPEHTWLSDNEHIIFHSVWRSREELICVNVATKKIKKLSQDETIGHWNLLDIQDDILVVSCSSPNLKPFLVLGKFNTDQKVESINWVKLSEEDKVIPNLSWEIITLDPDFVNQQYPNLQFQIILIQPKTKKESPLVFWPHGGPHCSSIADYNLFSTLFIYLGFSVALINYRGSDGYGEDNLRSLLGNVGCQDVADCLQALEFLIRKKGFKRDQIVAFGGSHGGFLVTHLIGQYPDHFKACVCRNPVTDIACQAGISDIPDWGWVEIGLDYEETSTSSPCILKTMWDKSPMQYVDQVETPTLILMGKLDLRVPPSQSSLYYHALKSRHVPVRMNIYEDNHSLMKPQVQADSFIHTYLWFKKYL